MARGVVAHLRAVDAAYPEAPELRELLAELDERSEEFAGLWRCYDVRARTNGRKVYGHPHAGRMALTYEALDVPRSGGQCLVIYQAPPGSRDHDALLLLAASAACAPGPGRLGGSAARPAPVLPG
ncbi:hypothetical protein AB0I22_04660 [Streptomyces sp. NPDC050610]|uniref:MmyB family transcriptional regulator n=1 Tax=Streptomyces sp. NPDC050610 TaxID=3157097 RepID=UPI00341A2F60